MLKNMAHEIYNLRLYSLPLFSYMQSCALIWLSNTKITWLSKMKISVILCLWNETLRSKHSSFHVFPSNSELLQQSFSPWRRMTWKKIACSVRRYAFCLFDTFTLRICCYSVIRPVLMCTKVGSRKSSHKKQFSRYMKNYKAKLIEY